MTQVTFFFQKRKDQAVRTGVEVNDELVLGRFTPGNEENDSALVWYIDVRCVTMDVIPADASSARAFLVGISEPVKAAFSSFAEELNVGLDADNWPVRRPIRKLPDGIKAEVVCSAMKRVTDGELSEALREMAKQWVENLNELPEIAPAIR